MKTILMMATTINGKIARPDGSTDWSKEDWDNFVSIAKRIGCVIIGKNTYDIAKKEGSMISGVYTVVMTHAPQKNDINDIFFTSASPREILRQLEQKGYSEVLVAGGGNVNAQFLNQKLINEIIIDVEPKIFGTGVSLFAENHFEASLELLDVKKLNSNTISLHYKVL